MTDKSNYIKVPKPTVILFSLLLLASVGYSVYSLINSSQSSVAGIQTGSSAKVTFSPEKKDRPEFQFYVMSFCPYGNMAEDAIRPVFDLLGDKVDFKPQYIFDKITNLAEYCKMRAGDISQCPQYVENKYFADLKECQKVVGENSKLCLDEKSYIKTGNSTYYASLHGRQEANQDLREICAYNQAANKKDWWAFVDNVNKNCNSDNADTCWEEQAKKANLDTAKITECFNKDAVSLIEAELALTDANKISGSPTMMINGMQFPPENAYTQDGKGSVVMGKVTVTQDKFRTPEGIKQFVCSAFNKKPKECNTTLADLTDTTSAAAAAGGCQ
jgi:hypothetical protein